MAKNKMISPFSFAKHGEEKLGGSFFDCCGCNHFWLVWFACIALGVLFMSLNIFFPYFTWSIFFLSPGTVVHTAFVFYLVFVSWFFVLCFVFPSLEFSVAGRRSVNLASAFS